MNTGISSRRLLRMIGIPLGVALVAYLVWDGSKGFSAGGICAGLGLLLAAGAMAYIKQMEVVSERNITQRIRTEYPPEAQSEVRKAYERLKVKELEGLFTKILDDANGDPRKAAQLAVVAEGVGWKAFMENRW